ncbi:MAG: hypothetical protein AAB581_01265 [Patescibacteria group bacterium]
MAELIAVVIGLSLFCAVTATRHSRESRKKGNRVELLIKANGLWVTAYCLLIFAALPFFFGFFRGMIRYYFN